MNHPGSRFAKMERAVTIALAADLCFFIILLFASGFNILWLKTVAAIFSLLIGLLCFLYLYLTKEWLRRRSLWMSVSAAAIVICVLFSLLLQFPSPHPGH